MKGVKQGPFYVVIFQIFQNGFKVIYEDQTTIEASELPTICIFQEMKSSSLVNFSKFWNIYFFHYIIISKLGNKGPKLYIMY